MQNASSIPIDFKVSLHPLVSDCENEKLSIDPTY